MSANRANAPYYFVPGPSRHPITASLGLLIVLLSSAAWVNAQPWAPWTFLIGLLWVAVSRENRSLQEVVLRTSVIYD